MANLGLFYRRKMHPGESYRQLLPIYLARN